jgi:hypothetical protein
MAELPAQSRISSRIAGDELILTIPKAAGGSRGCLAGSSSAAALFGFLAVTFAAQGIFTKNLGWSLAGFGCFVIAGWQLLALRGLPGNSSDLQIRIGNAGLSRLTGPADAVQRRDWKRSAVAELRVEEGELRLHLKDAKQADCLVSGLEQPELEWIAEQVRHKWKV